MQETLSTGVLSMMYIVMEEALHLSMKMQLQSSLGQGQNPSWLGGGWTFQPIWKIWTSQIGYHETPGR